MDESETKLLQPIIDRLSQIAYSLYFCDGCNDFIEDDLIRYSYGSPYCTKHFKKEWQREILPDQLGRMVGKQSSNT